MSTYVVAWPSSHASWHVSGDKTFEAYYGARAGFLCYGIMSSLPRKAQASGGVDYIVTGLTFVEPRPKAG